MPCCLRIVRNAHTSTTPTAAVRTLTMISSTVDPVLIVNAHASARTTPMMIRFLRLSPPTCGCGACGSAAAASVRPSACSASASACSGSARSGLSARSAFWGPVLGLFFLVFFGSAATLQSTGSVAVLHRVLATLVAAVHDRPEQARPVEIAAQRRLIAAHAVVVAPGPILVLVAELQHRVPVG